MLITKVQDAFYERFGAPAQAVVRAPGRVNLIGEHTDYNDGFVLPLALEHATYIALTPRDDHAVQLKSLELGETRFALERLGRGEGWPEYVKGMAWALLEDGFALRGWDGVLTSDVPVGAGLSSSAALELAVALAFSVSSGFAWQPTRMAQLARRAENDWVGAQTGIMDQLISACAVEGSALLIDCRTLETEPVPLPEGAAIIVMDTSTRHSHLGSGYNDRRSQCEDAAAQLGIDALRDISETTFAHREAELTELPRKRARHVVSENARTRAAASAMKTGDAVTLGTLMNASHDSMRDDFEISSFELDAIVGAAQADPSCYGARMTGGGFGGCAVALVQEGGVDRFCERVDKSYREHTGLEPAFYVCHGGAGASVTEMAAPHGGASKGF